MTWAIWLPPEQGLDFPLLRGMDLLADVLNYTDLTPQIQVSEMVAPPVLSGGLKLTGFPPVPFTVASATNVFP